MSLYDTPPDALNGEPCPDCGRPRDITSEGCNAYNDPDGTDCMRLTIDRLRAENERLQDAWCQDEGIAPDGELRALVSRTVKRAADLEALFAWIHGLTDPNAKPARCSDQPAPQNPPPSPTGDAE